MPERLFLFVQCELPWALGAPDGRYLLRSHTDGEPERVVVLGTLGARRALLARGSGRLARRAPARRRSVPTEPVPEPVPITRATIVDPISVSAERQAQAWLADFDSERELVTAFAALNRLLHARRIATADPYTREVSPAQALTIRAGWGEGEQVAEGLWLHAVKLPAADHPRTRVRRRASALRPDERLAELLGAREQPLLCEELTLRARLDLDQGRIAHAAVELDRALLAALTELAGEHRSDIPLRVSELRSLQAGVADAARAALGLEPGSGPGSGPGPEPDRDGSPGASSTTGEGANTPASGTTTPHAETRGAPAGTDEETIGHALGRLEATLRARSAAGYDRS